ncbi:MAG TPA: hypothetical protein VH008_10920 [Pseudonocardia sp.]|nr:hypothetical protein [Pseudonocardia sp.]
MFAGAVVDYDTLGDIPLTGFSAGPEVLAAVPFRQITERGFDCHDDRAPLRCLLIEEREEVAMEQVLEALPGSTPRIRDAGFATTDQAYADRHQDPRVGDQPRRRGELRHPPGLRRRLRRRPA